MAMLTEDKEVIVYINFLLLLFYFSNYPLSKYGYTHDCLKMGFDPSFSIMRRQDVALPFLRTVSLFDRSFSIMGRHDVEMILEHTKLH